MSSPPSPDAGPVIHGLRVHAPALELRGCAATRQADFELSVSIEVTHTAPSGAFEVPSPSCPGLPATELGEPIARLALNESVSYAFFQHDQTMRFFFPGLCSGQFDSPRRHLQLETDAPHFEIARLLVPNTLISAVLGVDEQVVLHASGVHINGRTLAICGPSRSGKTSLAALALQRGAAAVSDDALRVYTHDGGGLWCYPGSPELRLRATHAWPGLDPALVRPLPDGRSGYLARAIVHEQSPLTTAIFPVPSDAPAPSLQRVTGLRALGRLLSASRIAWTPSIGATMLSQLRRAADQIVIYDLAVPWHRFDEPNTQQALSEQLLQALER